MEDRKSFVGFHTTKSVKLALQRAAQKEGRTLSNYLHQLLEKLTDGKREDTHR